MRRALGIAVVLVVAGAGPALAQRIEIVPFVGYRFGGLMQNLTTGSRYEISPSLAYGGLLEVAFGAGNRFTLTYSRQDTDVDTAMAGAGIPVLLQYLEFGGTRDMKIRGTAQPFVTGGLGLLIASVPGTLVGSATRLSVSAALGARVPAGSRVALRAEARGYLSFVGSSSVAASCGGGGCAIAFQGTGLLQGELAAGITFRF
jgi:hypothetical protein